MTVILQVSDPHFGTELPPVVSALHALSQELKPDLLLLSGDITQRARSDQFARAATFLRGLALPHVLTIPGNHDVPLFNVAARAFTPYANYTRHFGRELEPHFEAPDCLVLTVDATRRYRHVDGEIDESQRTRIATALSRAKHGQRRVVALHQPVAVPRDREHKNVAHGAREAIQAWSEAGAELILSGHIHLPFVLPLHEAFELSRPLWAVGAGTAVSSRVRYDAPNSVNVIRVGAELVVEQWSFDQATQSFRRAAELRLEQGH
jgi:3',5'-cyclic AMP phosphodiesterase CpdA